MRVFLRKTRMSPAASGRSVYRNCPSGEQAFGSNPWLSLRSERGMRQAQFFGILLRRNSWNIRHANSTIWPGYFLARLLLHRACLKETLVRKALGVNPKWVVGRPLSLLSIQGPVGHVTPPVVVNLRQREPEAAKLGLRFLVASRVPTVGGGVLTVLALWHSAPQVLVAPGFRVEGHGLALWHFARRKPAQGWFRVLPLAGSEPWFVCVASAMQSIHGGPRAALLLRRPEAHRMPHRMPNHAKALAWQPSPAADFFQPGAACPLFHVEHSRLFARDALMMRGPRQGKMPKYRGKPPLTVA
jgi:hypothetical protein